MAPELLPLLVASIGAVAVLYASVGHGGASGYLAVMAIFSLAPAALKPTALILNIVVSAVAAWLFLSARHFSWRLFWPFVVTSIPASYLGGTLVLPPNLYRWALGLTLLLAAWRLLCREEAPDRPGRPPHLLLAMLIGLVLGFLSGLIGVGGGIFLSPLMVLFGWGRVREISGVAALFILVNSTSGLFGHLGSLQAVPDFAPQLAASALAGGALGALGGSRHLPVTAVVKTLAVVLSVAGVKLLLT